MTVKYTDFNNADVLLNGQFAAEWGEINSVLANMSLHLKPSDQKGKQGQPIFDPVGTNHHIKEELKKVGWQANAPVPTQFRMWGTDIDFSKSGVVGEAQFSNYPFLLNNLIRSELFYHSKTAFSSQPTSVVVIIMKAHMLPSSNSTLYYEQAVKQINSISGYNVFDVPLRLVGLYETSNSTINVVWTKYSASRYSRTVQSQATRQCKIATGRARCDLTLI